MCLEHTFTHNRFFFSFLFFFLLLQLPLTPSVHSLPLGDQNRSSRATLTRLPGLRGDVSPPRGGSFGSWTTPAGRVSSGCLGRFTTPCTAGALENKWLNETPAPQLPVPIQKGLLVIIMLAYFFLLPPLAWLMRRCSLSPVVIIVAGFCLLLAFRFFTKRPSWLLSLPTATERIFLFLMALYRHSLYLCHCIRPDASNSFLVKCTYW